MYRTLIFVSLLLPACDDEQVDDTASSPEAIDCDWFASDNCWRTTVEAAIACVPEGGVLGTFDADRTTCTGTDGTVIRFATPTPEKITGDEVWDFDVEADGETCFSYLMDDEGLVGVTSAGTFEETRQAATVSLACPDGSVYTIGAFDMLQCDWDTLPGIVTWSTMGTVSFELGGNPGAIGTVFTCSPAA